MTRTTKWALQGSLGLWLVLGVGACGAAAGPAANDKTTVTIEKPLAGSAPATNPGPDAGK
jgi:hypothetical protein